MICKTTQDKLYTIQFLKNCIKIKIKHSSLIELECMTTKFLFLSLSNTRRGVILKLTENTYWMKTLTYEIRYFHLKLLLG